MQLRISPVIKGLITAVLMIALALIIASKKNTTPEWQYLLYLVYAAGIIWTLISFSRSGTFSGKFSELFGQGFRCFIVVTLVMVIFTGIFIKIHPEYAEQEAKATREYYHEKADKTASEIEEMAQKAKKQYPVIFISISIFRYLVAGAVFTTAVSGFLTRRK